MIFRDVTKSKSNPNQFRELQMAARRDPLTGVGNRGELESRLARMFASRAEQQEPRPLSVIFLDIDHFKSINDTHGHSVGDQVLIDLARLVEDELYSGETICRYGGKSSSSSARTRRFRMRSSVLSGYVERSAARRWVASPT